MAHEGQGDADHWRQAHDHHQIDRDIEEDRRRHARRQQLAEPVVRIACHGQGPIEDQRKAADHHDAAH